MIPGLLILVAAGSDAFWARTGSAWPFLGMVFGLLLLGHPTLYAAYHLVRPQQVEETRPLLQYLAQERRAGDVLYLYYESGPAARYFDQARQGRPWGLRSGRSRPLPAQLRDPAWHWPRVDAVLSRERRAWA